MAEQPRTTDDEDLEGTSESALPLDQVQDARGDAGARDLVGADSDDELLSEDGVYGDDDIPDPADQAVIEAGGGVAEGFEQSEAALVGNATDSEGSTRDILFDAIEDEDDLDDDDTYGEADDVDLGDLGIGGGDDDY
jgi:hypothetical protein